MYWNIWFVFGAVLIFVAIAIYFALRRKKVMDARQNPQLNETSYYDAIGRTEFTDNSPDVRNLPDTEDSEKNTGAKTIDLKERGRHFSQNKGANRGRKI